jgi:protein-tyrosine-phosphatase
MYGRDSLEIDKEYDAMSDQRYEVHCSCTGNPVRSILAGALLNRGDKGSIRACSASNQPKGVPSRYALELLAELGYETTGFRSKSRDELSGANAPPLDLVITVCDSAAGEICPLFIGTPVKVHWGAGGPGGGHIFYRSGTRCLQAHLPGACATGDEPRQFAVRDDAADRTSGEVGRDRPDGWRDADGARLGGLRIPA